MDFNISFWINLFSAAIKQLTICGCLSFLNINSFLYQRRIEIIVISGLIIIQHIIAPHIMKMVEFFNRVVMMVTSSILAEETVYRRAKVVQKAIKVIGFLIFVNKMYILREMYCVLNQLQRNIFFFKFLKLFKDRIEFIIMKIWRILTIYMNCLEWSQGYIIKYFLIFCYIHTNVFHLFLYIVIIYISVGVKISLSEEFQLIESSIGWFTMYTYIQIETNMETSPITIQKV